MNHEPKIGKVAALILISVAVIVDTIGIILVFFLLDDFFILDMLMWPTVLYFKSKKVDNFNDKLGTILEFFPYIGALPLKTLGIVLVILEDRNPENKFVNFMNNTVGKMNPKKMFK